MEREKEGVFLSDKSYLLSPFLVGPSLMILPRDPSHQKEVRRSCLFLACNVNYLLNNEMIFTRSLKLQKHFVMTVVKVLSSKSDWLNSFRVY